MNKAEPKLKKKTKLILLNENEINKTKNLPEIGAELKIKKRNKINIIKRK